MNIQHRRKTSSYLNLKTVSPGPPSSASTDVGGSPSTVRLSGLRKVNETDSNRKPGRHASSSHFNLRATRPRARLVALVGEVRRRELVAALVGRAHVGEAEEEGAEHGSVADVETEWQIGTVRRRREELAAVKTQL